MKVHLVFCEGEEWGHAVDVFTNKECAENCAEYLNSINEEPESQQYVSQEFELKTNYVSPDITKSPAACANFSDSHHGISVRVMCPKCGKGGGHPINWPQPKCHKCDYEVLMEPASNTKIECSWEEAQKYAKYLETVWKE